MSENKCKIKGSLVLLENLLETHKKKVIFVKVNAKKEYISHSLLNKKGKDD